MQLTCPTCGSGLQVPEGTTAHVRCPACKTVFPAEDGLAPAVPVPGPPPKAPPLPKPSPLRIDDEDEPRPAPKPQPKPKPRREEDNDERDGVADEPEKRPKRVVKSKQPLTLEEKRVLRAGFSRGFYGARLIQISLFFYIPAVLFVPLHQILVEITKDEMPFVLVIAGILGLVNWILGAIGICLCLSGPPSPGHYRFGIGGIVATFVHGMLLLAVVAKSQANADYRGLDRNTMMWAQIATQYESLSFYLSYMVYPDDIPLKRSDTILGFLTGISEMTRLILYLMMLGCLAQAAGDKELSEDCTRMAGRITVIPGLLALGMLGYKIIVIETGASGSFMLYLLNYIYRSITLVAAGILGMSMRTIGDVADACESPYQTGTNDMGSG